MQTTLLSLYTCRILELEVIFIPDISFLAQGMLLSRLSWTHELFDKIVYLLIKLIKLYVSGGFIALPVNIPHFLINLKVRNSSLLPRLSAFEHSAITYTF